jgi:hypothetical protein
VTDIYKSAENREELDSESYLKLHEQDDNDNL